MFRLSTQAQQNFNDLYVDIKELAQDGGLGDQKSFSLTMDQETYVAKFDADVGLRLLSIREEYWDTLGERVLELDKGLSPVFKAFPLAGSPRRQSYDIEYPFACKRKDCLVLCREFELKDTPYANKKTMVCKKPVIKILEDSISIRPFFLVRGSDKPEDATLYELGNIRRHVVELTKFPLGDDTYDIQISGNVPKQFIDAEKHKVKTPVDVDTNKVSLQVGQNTELIAVLTPQEGFAFYKVDFKNEDHEGYHSLNVMATPELTLNAKKYGHDQATSLQSSRIEFRFLIEGKMPGSFEPNAEFTTIVSPLYNPKIFFKRTVPVSWEVVVNEP